MADSEPVVDLCFPARGESIPADHGYALLGALSRYVPEVHGDRSVAVHPIAGRLVGGRLLALNGLSQVAIRLPLRMVPSLLNLAGQRLDLGGYRLELGLPSVRELQPVPTLVSRLVVIKGFLEAEGFLEAARRQLGEREIAGEAALLRRQRDAPRDGGQGSHQAVLRRTLRIRDREVVGFALAVTNLDARDSVRLQELGLGGRQRFGCGVFVPWRT